jgi:hypothetical protein
MSLNVRRTTRRDLETALTEYNAFRSAMIAAQTGLVLALANIVVSYDPFVSPFELFSDFDQYPDREKRRLLRKWESDFAPDWCREGLAHIRITHLPQPDISAFVVAFNDMVDTFLDLLQGRSVAAKIATLREPGFQCCVHKWFCIHERQLRAHDIRVLDELSIGQELRRALIGTRRLATLWAWVDYCLHRLDGDPT